MSAFDVAFDRVLLSQVMPDVKKHIAKETLKGVWTYKGPYKGYFEFHINKCPQFPTGVYVSGQANSAYEIRYRGFMRALEILEVEGYVR